MVSSLPLVVSCENLKLSTPFVKACWKGLNKVELEVFKIWLEGWQEVVRDGSYN